MAYSKNGLGFRLESAEGASAAANYDAEKSLAVNEDAAAAVGEADMVGTENEDLGNAMDASVDAAEELGTEVLPAMAEAADTDGFTPREAEAVQARLESICRRAGIDFASTGLTMRRESFGASASRKVQTRMRLEAAQGVFGKIWENLKKAWLWLKDQLGAIWGKYTKNAEMIKKRLTDIQTRATKLASGAKPDKSRLKVQARFFSVNRQFDVEKVIKSVTALSGAVDALHDSLSVTTFAKLVSQMGINGANKAAEAFADTLAKDFTDKFTENRDEAGISRNFKNGTGNDESDDIQKVVGVLPSGRSFVVAKAKVVSGDISVDIAKVTLEIVEDSFADDYEAPKTTTAINALVNQGLGVINLLIKADKQKAQTEALIANVVAICDSSAKAATAEGDAQENADKDKVRNSITVRIAILRAVQGIAKTLAYETPRMQFDTAVALADVAAAAVSNMKEEKK